MGHTGLRTKHEYGHIFKTISSLETSGQEVEPDFCCQENGGLCTDGVMIGDVPRDVRSVCVFVLVCLSAIASRRYLLIL